MPLKKLENKTEKIEFPVLNEVGIPKKCVRWVDNVKHNNFIIKQIKMGKTLLKLYNIIDTFLF